MHRTSGKRASALGLWLLLWSVTGCADGPFAELAEWNPYYRKQWQHDEERGPTFHKRMAELQTLRREAAQLAPGDQERFVGQLIEILRNDRNPALRAESVKTLSKFPTPSILPGLQLAATDEDGWVRVAACRAWGQLGGPEALKTLAEVIQHDANLDVRIAATKELARFREPGVVEALGVALNENDPAIQYEAVQSLKSATGRDLGDSVPAWRDFVAGRTTMPSEQPSLVERLRRLF